MKNVNKILMIAIILLLVMGNAFAGGGNRTGTGGAAELLIPVGARGISMAESNVSTSTGVDAIFWNPAGTAKMDNSASVVFSHMNYIADIGVEYGAVSANFEGLGVLSFSLKSLSVGNILVTTNQNPDGTGETFSPQHLVAGLTYSRQLTERIAVGFTANLVSETLGQVSASGVAFNIGVMYDNLVDVPGLSFGVVMKNVGPQMKFDGSGLDYQAAVQDLNSSPGFVKIDAAAFELPSTFELGVGYKPQFNEQNTLQFAGTFVHNNFSGDEYKIGAEYAFDNTLFVRGGYTTSPKDQTDEYLYGPTAGFGLNYQMQGIGIKADYAYRYVKFFGANHVFSVGLAF